MNEVTTKNFEIDYEKIYLEEPNRLTPTPDDIACELQLSALGDWAPLTYELDQSLWLKNLPLMEPWWHPYQPKPNVQNDRECVLIYGAEGDKPNSLSGIRQLYEKLGRWPLETEMNHPTEAQQQLSVMHEVFDTFDLGRTFLIKLNQGGFFPKHRDHIHLTRESFRLIAFLGDNHKNFEFELDGIKRTVIPNTVYYFDTRKEHRLHCWENKNDNAMVVMNIKKDWNNILRLMTKIGH